MAVAARCDGDQDGLGVDFEGWRPMDPRIARFYLHPDERGDLLRLWTVKEAVFKATPGNGGASCSTTGWTTPAPSTAWPPTGPGGGSGT